MNVDRRRFWVGNILVCCQLTGLQGGILSWKPHMLREEGYRQDGLRNGMKTASEPLKNEEKKETENTTIKIN